MDKKYFKNALEWFGVITAIVYSLLVASNTGHEVIGFTLLFISAIAIGLLGIFVQASWNFSASIFLRDRWYNWCGEMAVKGEFEKRIGEVNETIFYRT